LLSNYGQLRRNTDPRTRHRHAQLCVVTALLITTKLIDWRDRWDPKLMPYPLDPLTEVAKVRSAGKSRRSRKPRT
jgi:hypothetical protein